MRYRPPNSNNPAAPISASILPEPLFERAASLLSSGVAITMGATGTKVASVATRVGTGLFGNGVDVATGNLCAISVTGGESGGSGVGVAITDRVGATSVLLTKMGKDVGVSVAVLAELSIGVTVAPIGTVAVRVGDGPSVGVFVGSGV